MSPPSVMVKRYYQVNRKDLALVQFIIEGYEGMASITTVDPQKACVQISVIENLLDDFELLAEDLKNTFGIKEVPWPS
jgi:antitoxin component HigA of HigAB toxin-antitoxin module